MAARMLPVALFLLGCAHRASVAGRSLAPAEDILKSSPDLESQPNRAPECMSLKPRQRPAKRAIINMRALMEKCADIHAAAECLRFLDEQEGGYTVLPHAEHPENDSSWTMMPLSPKPVHLHHNALLPMLYHTYSSGMGHDRLDVMVDSFLFTQPLELARLNVWFDSVAELAAYANHRGRRGMKHVRLQDFSIHGDKVQQLESVPRPDDVPVMPDKVGLSDKVRMILLLEYGGLWVDADTVFLRDLSPFWPYEWAERWSLHAAHNTAMLRLFAGSRIGRTLWERAFALNDTSFYPMKLVTLLKGTGHQLPALPSPVMDPPFLLLEDIAATSYERFSFVSKDSFFTDQIHSLYTGDSPCKDGHLRFFNGAFAYHWSTYWDNREPAIEGTYFHALKTITSDFVAGRTANLYGEMGDLG